MSNPPVHFVKNPDQPFKIDTLLDLALKPGTQNVYIGEGGNYPILGVYGGHLVGQALAAGFRNIAEDRLASSIHVNFLKGPKAEVPIEYHVEDLRDGGRYSVRSIRAIQNDELMVIATATFKVPEQGDEHAAPAPKVPDAETLIQEEQEEGKDPFLMPITGHGVDIVQTDGWLPMVADHGDPQILQWIKAQIDQTDDPRHRQCVLAYLSDSTIMFAALRPHGNFATHASTSVDHTIWFYEECNPKDWLLFESISPVAAGNRGFSRVSIFDKDRKLVATAAQENAMRRR